MPELQNYDEHDMPQIHNIELYTESATIIQTRQDSGSQIATVEYASCVKPAV